MWPPQVVATPKTQNERFETGSGVRIRANLEIHTRYVFGMGASKRPCVFEVFGVGWGGVGGCVITFMSLACKVMRRGCYVDVALIIFEGTLRRR